MNIINPAKATDSLKEVSRKIRKKDSMSLLTGKPVYTDDLAPKNCLVIKLLKSPHANAMIKTIDAEAARNVMGIACILTYEDVPNVRFTTAGQAYPELSPYDRLILDRHLRYMGDPVAIVAGVDEKIVNQAIKMIQVTYDVLEPVLDFTKALDNPILVHPEEDFSSLPETLADPKRNLCATSSEGTNFAEIYENCEVKVEATYHTKANSQTPMETFRTFATIDAYGRLNIVSSTQIPFHVRRILSHALQIPKAMIRVIKPRIGGGFGSKQTSVSEMYPAIVTWKTGMPSKIVYTREESFTTGSPRHEMELTVRIGSDPQGSIQAISIYSLSNAGAYGTHGSTTVSLSGHKPLPIYNAAKAFQFDYDVVYTNTLSAGAYRGFGATQGFFAVESAIDELAHKLGMDPSVLREKNMVREGQIMPAYYNEVCTSCTLDRCLSKAKEMIGWDQKYPYRKIGEHRVRSVGLAMAMQSSGIPDVDVGSAEIKLADGGFYILMNGAADMGTGSDTVLSQIAAERLKCSVDNIIVHSADTDLSPYDTGSYASSTTYVTGMAVIKACDALIEILKTESAAALNCSKEDLDFDGRSVYSTKEEKRLTLSELAYKSMLGSNRSLSACASHSSSISPPPFIVGACEIEVDLETGKITPIDFVAVADCGTPINPNLARVQMEGGIVQAIGMALYENVSWDDKGALLQNSFMQYKIPTRLDVGTIRTAIESSYEASGPFGAKSIGEVVINTPAPAIANAIYNATGLRFRTLPITGEDILLGLEKLEQEAAK